MLGQRCVPHCFFLFWRSARSPLIFNVLHQHRLHMVPDSHANKSPASSAKHMNPDLHANKSPASTAKHMYHLHCTLLNYKTQHYMTKCKCSHVICLSSTYKQLSQFISAPNTVLHCRLYCTEELPFPSLSLHDIFYVISYSTLRITRNVI